MIPLVKQTEIKVNNEQIDINEINDRKAKAKWSQINPFRSRTKTRDYTQYTLIMLIDIIITIIIGHPYVRRWFNNRRKIKSHSEDIYYILLFIIFAIRVEWFLY